MVAAVAGFASLVSTGGTAWAGTSGGLDTGALRKAIEIRPGDHLGGVLASVQKDGQSWHGQTPDTVTGKPIPANASYRIGSISKVYESTVVLQLAAERRVNLNRTIQSYLPGLLPARYKPITVRQLLNHTSGLPDVDEGAPPSTNDQIIAGRFAHRTLTQIVQGTLRPVGRPWPKPHFAPGTKQEYNSLGYRIAALLVEKLTGHSYQREVTDRILRPLRLRHTFLPGANPNMPKPYVHGYVANDAGQLVDTSRQADDASGMISTPRDTDAFFTALYRGRLLPAAQFKEMTTLPNVPYANKSDCFIGPDAGRACYAVGLNRLKLANGPAFWGKTGHDLGYASGFSATLDLRWKAFYTTAQTVPNGGLPPTALRLAAAMGLRAS
jgi:D-alanyl-D-alanine carboxypeptidase